MKRYFQLFKEAWAEFTEDKAQRLGAALAFYTLFSIAPLLVIAIAIAGLVFGRSQAQSQIIGQLLVSFAVITVLFAVIFRYLPDVGIECTHQDDVADHEKFHERFGCQRVLHRDDIRSRTASVELQPTGLDPLQIDDDLLMIPTPGHTKGHSVFLYREKFLFTGDHLAWDPDDAMLIAFRNACWYSWSEQTKSMARLLDYKFEWSCPAMAGRSTCRPARCTLIWSAASSG